MDSKPELETSSCAICLCDVSEYCTLSHCVHEFCFPCISKWTKLNTSCPVCREPVCWILDAAGEQHVVGAPKRQAQSLAPPEDYQTASELQYHDGLIVGRRRPTPRVLLALSSSSYADDEDWIVHDSDDEWLDDAEFIPEPDALEAFLQRPAPRDEYPRWRGHVVDEIISRHQRIWQAIPATPRKQMAPPVLAAERRLPPLVGATSSSSKRQKTTHTTAKKYTAPSAEAPSPSPSPKLPSIRRPATTVFSFTPTPSRTAFKSSPTPFSAAAAPRTTNSSILEAMRRRGF